MGTGAGPTNERSALGHGQDKLLEGQRAAARVIVNKEGISDLLFIEHKFRPQAMVNFLASGVRCDSMSMHNCA